MNRNGKDAPVERLDLQSRMSELARLPAWIERLAARHTIPPNTQFAMNLCLEEALSNIIRHGYSGNPGHSIAVGFTNPRGGYFVFEVEDEAPPFNPVASPELPPLSFLEESQIGGQGIRLLRQFADALEYQATPSGNRLRIGFIVADSAMVKE